MLKHKVKSLQKELKQLSKSKMSGVFFVGNEEGEYTVKAAGRKVVFRGDKEGYNSFVRKYDDESVFIIDDIPREETGVNIHDWV